MALYSSFMSRLKVASSFTFFPLIFRYRIEEDAPAPSTSADKVER